MVEFISQVAKEHGLFVALVVYVLWFFDRSLKEHRKEAADREARLQSENAEREARYVGVIDKLSDSFSQLAVEVQQIKSLMERDRRDEGRKIV